MYRSLLMLNPRSRAARHDLADCQALHRTIMGAFPDLTGNDAARASLGVLYRVDTHPRNGLVSILVQSRQAPDWSRLEADYLLATHGEPDNPRVQDVGSPYAVLQVGQVLAFRLRANPTRKIDTKSGPDGQRRNGKRVELRDDAVQVDWLRRRGEQAGFELLGVRGGGPNARTTVEDKLLGRHPVELRAATTRLTFGSVLFEGELRVVDADRFRQALEVGIGPGKAYGCGLLSIARPSR